MTVELNNFLPKLLTAVEFGTLEDLSRACRQARVLGAQRQAGEFAPSLPAMAIPTRARTDAGIALAQWLYAQGGWTQSELAELLNDEHVRTATGRSWSQGTLGRYLIGLGPES